MNLPHLVTSLELSKRCTCGGEIKYDPQDSIVMKTDGTCYSIGADSCEKCGLTSNLINVKG